MSGKIGAAMNGQAVRLIFALIAVFALVRAALAEPVVLAAEKDFVSLGRALEILDDAPAGADVADVAAGRVGRWVKSEVDAPGFGYARSEAWARFELARRGHGSERWFIVHRGARTELVSLFKVVDGRAIPLGETGLFAATDPSRPRTRLPHVEIALAQGEVATFLAKVEQRGPLHLTMTVETPESYFHADQGEQLLFGILFGVLFGVAIYGLIHWRAVQEPASLWLCVFLLSLVFYLVNFTGFTNRYLWTGPAWWSSFSGFLSIILAVVTGCGFTLSFLRLRKIAPWLQRVILGFACYTLGLLVVHVWDARLAFQLMSYSVLAAAALQVWAGVISVAGEDKTDARDYLFAWLVIIAGALSRVFIDIGLITPSPIAANFIYVAIGVAAVLFAYAIAAQFGRRQAQRSRDLAEGAERYALAVRGSNDGIYDWDIRRASVYASPRLMRIFGMRPGDVDGRIGDWMKILHPDDAEGATRAIREFLKSGHDMFTAEFRIVRPDGTTRWLVVRSVVLRGPDKRAHRMAGSVSDVTERHAMVEALRASESRYALAARGSDAGLFEVDLVARKAYYTPRFYEIWRRRPEEVGDRLDAFLRYAHPDDLSRAMEFQSTFLASDRKSMSIDFRAVMPDGTIRWLRTAAATERDAGGRPIRIAGATGDITEQKLLEQRLLQAQKMEAIGQLAGGIAHDFNNVLSIIGGYATILKRKASKIPDVAEAASRIQEGIDRAAGMTREMLAFGRRNPINARPIDLAGLIRGQERLLRPLLGAEIRLEVEAPDEPVAIRADKNQIAQAIMNLAINARDAMPKGGTMAIRLGRAADARAEIVVADTGVGMDEATLGRIFEPFFTTKAPGKGTGLGLAMVYGIVTQSEGTIDVRSSLGKGATFVLRFPVSADPIVEDDAAYVGPVRSTVGETVLVAEDESALRALVEKTLEEAGYEVLAASDGVSALEIADAARDDGRRIDLLLTDLVMPQMGGVELARLFEELFPEARVLYMTGYPSRGDHAQGELPKDATVLYKPIDLDRLLAGIAAALASKRTSTTGKAAE